MIRFHPHALVRIAERQLRREWVEATVIAPDRTAPDLDDPTVTRAFRTISQAQGRVLRVATGQTAPTFSSSQSSSTEEQGSHEGYI